jgi:hypothetical protein
MALYNISNLEQVVTVLVREMMKFLSQDIYVYAITKKDIQYAQSIIKITKNATSSAGAHRIAITKDYWQTGEEHHLEYASFNKHPIIGKIKVASHLEHLIVVVAHELSHHVQWRLCPGLERFKLVLNTPHGQVFKEVYTVLRKDFVNPIITQKQYPAFFAPLKELAAGKIEGDIPEGVTAWIKYIVKNNPGIKPKEVFILMESNKIKTSMNTIRKQMWLIKKKEYNEESIVD